MTTRRSPIEDWLEHSRPLLNDVGALQSLALCDLSALPKIGIKGADAENFVADQGIDVPRAIYESRQLADGGLIVRLAMDEFILESGIAGGTVSEVSANLDAADGKVFRVERQEATFLLIGCRAIDVLAQSCGINFHETTARRLVLTRVAGVNAGVFPETIASQPAFRIWVDYTYALYLWEALVQICEDLDGKLVDAGCIFPELR